MAAVFPCRININWLRNFLLAQKFRLQLPVVGNQSYPEGCQSFLKKLHLGS